MTDRYVYSQIDYSDAVNFLLPRHYSGRVPQVQYAYGVVDKTTNAIVAVCTFGIPASNTMCKSVGGVEYKNSVFELNRLCREEDYKRPLSEFVAWCLKQLKPKNVYVVSYSDTAMNHHGYIYQATNFLYTGMTKPNIDIFTYGKHPRSYTKDDVKNKYWQIRSVKHRYVYICACTKNIKKKMLHDLKLPIVPYPKGDNNKDYTLGEYLGCEIVYKESGEVSFFPKELDLSNRQFPQQTYLFLE